MAGSMFDPKTYPSLGSDGHLPCVPQERLNTNYIRSLFAQHRGVLELGAQLEEEFLHDQNSSAPDLQDHDIAAILFAFVDRDEPTLLLTQRAAHLRKHAGQIAFAGGRVDPRDASEQHAALREAQEEIGLSPKQVEVLGLMPKYITGTGFLVTPVFGLVRPEYESKLNTQEVSDVFEVPLAFLMNPANHRRHERSAEHGLRRWYSMSYKDRGGIGVGQMSSQERFIWGATAGMIRNFYQILIQA